MPQNVENLDKKNVGVAPESGAYLHIKYTITTTEDNNNLSSEEFETYYGLADIFGNQSLKFAEGSQYTLSIEIAPDVINFKTSIDENSWDSQSVNPESGDIAIK